MANWKKVGEIMAATGKVAASDILNLILPGSGGIIQGLEYIFGAKSGAEKKRVATQIGLVYLEALAKAGRLDSAAPIVAEVESKVQTVVDVMKAAGTLEEAGTASVGGKTYNITVLGKLPE